MSKADAAKKIGGDSGNGKLLNEIEAISKALYLDRNPSRSLIHSLNSNPTKSSGKNRLADSKVNSAKRGGDEEPPRKEKKSLWKALKAFSHIRNRRFNCCFTLHVHSVEGLPSNFDDSSLCIHWKRRDGVLVTRPVKVFQGVAEFEEKLIQTCSVYGSRNGPHHSAKYEAKHFLLFASVYGAPEIDLGKHRVDLTRLLPLTLEELEEEKSAGQWTTSFKLSGKGKGARMNVSFGYIVIGDNSSATGNTHNVPELLNLKQNGLSIKTGSKFELGDKRGSIRHVESLPSISNHRRHSSSRSVEDIKDLHEVLPIARSELASSVNMLYKKFDEENSDAQVDHKPEMGDFTEHFEPKPSSSPLSDSGRENIGNECEVNDFSVIEQGVELSTKEPLDSENFIFETADVSPVASRGAVEIDTGVQVTDEKDPKLNFESQGEKNGNNVSELSVHNCTSEEDDICTKESLMKELESALNCVSDMETAALESPEREDGYKEINLDNDSRKGKSLSLDDVTESVASEFLYMLGIQHSPSALSSESEPDSPRERLLRQFEKEALAGGYSLFDFDVGSSDKAECGYDDASELGWGNSTEVEFSSMIQAAEEEHLIATQEARSKTKAKIVEDLETEALMREWGFNERAFQHSPTTKNPAGFGSPIDLPIEEPLELPSLGDGLGPFLQTKNGGFMRSMNPSLFTNAKSGGNLIMQVSKPVVVPAEMGSGIMEILQRLASVGIEKLSMQANKLMPLEDVTGKTMQQVAWEASPALEGFQSECLLQHEAVGVQENLGGSMKGEGKSSRLRSKSSKTTSSSIGSEIGSEYVSLEDLAPLAMDKIEALSIEGLRIQSGMSDEDAPSNISAKSIGEISALQGKDVDISGSIGMEGAGGLQLLDIKDSGEDVDGLMGLSLTLDEWMRLDSGDIEDEDHISEHTSKILAAHHAHSLDFVRGMRGEKRRGKGSNKKCGLLGNNFTVALMVQLRDPIRNYEPVGTPMLALIQVERVFVPPKPRIYSKVSELRNNHEDDDDEAGSVVKEEIKEETKEDKSLVEEGIPQFKITEVHVAGLKTDTANKKPWGTPSQQQSGSRWLLANGMGKGNKHPLMKSKTASKSSAPSSAKVQPASKSSTPLSTKVQPGDTLWSVSSRVDGGKWSRVDGAKWKQRNPNVVFPR